MCCVVPTIPTIPTTYGVVIVVTSLMIVMNMTTIATTTGHRHHIIHYIFQFSAKILEFEMNLILNDESTVWGGYPKVGRGPVIAQLPKIAPAGDLV